MTPESIPLAHQGDPTPPIGEAVGLRPVLLVLIRGIAERLEGPHDAAVSPARLDVDLAIRQLDTAALAPATRKAYAGALRRFDDWLDGRPPTDGLLARHLDEMFERGLAPASAALVVAALRRAVRDLARTGYGCGEHPVGPVTLERLARCRREAAHRGRGHALRQRQQALVRGSGSGNVRNRAETRTGTPTCIHIQYRGRGAWWPRPDPHHAESTEERIRVTLPLRPACNTLKTEENDEQHRHPTTTHVCRTANPRRPKWWHYSTVPSSSGVIPARQVDDLLPTCGDPLRPVADTRLYRRRWPVRPRRIPR